MTGVSEQEARQARGELKLNLKVADDSFENLGKVGRKGTAHIMCSGSAMEQLEFMEDLLMVNDLGGKPKPSPQNQDAENGSDQAPEVLEVADQTLKNKKFRAFQTKMGKAVFDVRVALKEGVLALHIEMSQRDQSCDVASELDVVRARSGLALSWLSESMLVCFSKVAKEIKEFEPIWTEIGVDELVTCEFAPKITMMSAIEDGSVPLANKRHRVENPCDPPTNVSAPPAEAPPAEGLRAEAPPAEAPSLSLVRWIPNGAEALPADDGHDEDIEIADAQDNAKKTDDTQTPPSADEAMKDASGDQTGTDLAKRHAAMQRMHAGLQGKSPVEQFEVFCTKHALLVRVEGLKRCDTTSKLEEDSDFLENQISMVKQLATSVKKGAKDMLKVVNEHQKTMDADKVKVDKAEKAEEEAKASEKEREAREAVLKMKHAQIFAVNIETCGHNTLSTMVCLSDANTKLKGEKLFEPFVVTDAAINTFLEHAKIKPILDKFCADFPQSDVCKVRSRIFFIKCVVKRYF